MSAHSHTIQPPPELTNHPQYDIVRELGRGGMGVVYLAHNKRLNRKEVLKVMSPDLVNRAGVRARFEREMQAAAGLRHANVVAALSSPEAGALLVLAMEYVDGPNLEDLVQERVAAGKGLLPIVNACYYIQQAARGLQHAHENGLVHRDIKPGNLMLAREGKSHIVKILDFGIAKATSEREDVGKLTAIGQMLGTPQYMAPEQFLDAADADIRADIYSLGCTLYFLLTGELPFSGKSLASLLDAHRNEAPPPIDRVRPEAPPALVAVVVRMMAKEPARRYQEPKDVVAALAPFIKAGTMEAPPAGAATRIGKKSQVQTARGETLLENEPVELPDPLPERRAPAVAWWKWGLGALVVVGAFGACITATGIMFFLPKAASEPEPPAKKITEPPPAVTPAPAADPFQVGSNWIGEGQYIFSALGGPRTFRCGVSVTKRTGNEFQGVYSYKGGTVQFAGTVDKHPEAPGKWKVHWESTKDLAGAAHQRNPIIADGVLEGSELMLEMTQVDPASRDPRAKARAKLKMEGRKPVTKRDSAFLIGFSSNSCYHPAWHVVE